MKQLKNNLNDEVTTTVMHTEDCMSKELDLPTLHRLISERRKSRMHIEVQQVSYPLIYDVTIVNSTIIRLTDEAA